MESRWIKTGNGPDMEYTLRNGGNKLYVAYREFDHSPAWLFISITNPPKSLIDHCSIFCKTTPNIKEPDNYLYLTEDSGKDTRTINYFVTAINDHYPLDESIKHDIDAFVNTLAKRNLPFKMHYGAGGVTLFNSAVPSSIRMENLFTPLFYK